MRKRKNKSSGTKTSDTTVTKLRGKVSCFSCLAFFLALLFLSCIVVSLVLIFLPYFSSLDFSYCIAYFFLCARVDCIYIYIYIYIWWPCVVCCLFLCADMLTMCIAFCVCGCVCVCARARACEWIACTCV